MICFMALPDLSGRVSATPSYRIWRKALTDSEAAWRMPLRASPNLISGAISRARLNRLIPIAMTLHRQTRPIGRPKNVNIGADWPRPDFPVLPSIMCNLGQFGKGILPNKQATLANIPTYYWDLVLKIQKTWWINHAQGEGTKESCSHLAKDQNVSKNLWHSSMSNCR